MVIENISNVRVIKSNNQKNDVAVLFIHGNPGSADAFYNYLIDSRLLKRATLITYDRPGFGYSSYGEPMTSIKDQVNAIIPSINQYKKVYVVGHSYGGPIATYLALKASNVKGVVLIAPTLYPHKEKFYGLAKLGISWFGRFLSSKAVYVASLEKITHQKALEEVEEEWRKLTCPLTHIHSTDDKIVPFNKNIEYTTKTFTKAKVKLVRLNDGNHFLPWNHYDLITENIIELINSEQSAK